MSRMIIRVFSHILLRQQTSGAIERYLVPALRIHIQNQSYKLFLIFLVIGEMVRPALIHFLLSFTSIWNAIAHLATEVVVVLLTCYLYDDEEKLGTNIQAEIHRVIEN